MSRKLWLASALAIVGLLTLFAASAGARTGHVTQTHATGGTIQIDTQDDMDFTDPALAYYQLSWELEYATCVKLLNYRDGNGAVSGQLIPEAATGFPKVSDNGKTYDFTVNGSFTKFSNGQSLTAANFKAAFDRDADPKMQSPAVPFFSDVVGSNKSPVSGVVVKGNHLIIHLTAPAPDFLARVAMPFFCAIPTNLPHDPNGVDAPAGAGPYYIASRTPGKSIVLKKNPYYHGKRPHNVNEFDYNVGVSLASTWLRIQQNQTDYADEGVPPADYAQAAQMYGVNKSRFFIKPILSVNYFAFNHDRPDFKIDAPKSDPALGNVNLMKAINYAIDRHAILSLAGYGAGIRSDQILPPGMEGFKKLNTYPIKGPNLAEAKKLAAGHTGDGTLVYYTCNAGTCPTRAQLVQYELGQIGIKLDIKPFSRSVQFQSEGVKGAPFDIADEGWLADYPDPYDFINVLLSGANIHATNNNNFAYFNDPNFNKQMQAAELLSGSKRYSTYGQLDDAIMNTAAPWAPRSNATDRIVFSDHVGCFTYSNAYTTDLAAMCHK